jgi:hypothetical protein
MIVLQKEVIDRARRELGLEDSSEAEVLEAIQRNSQEMIDGIGIFVARCAARLEAAIYWDGQAAELPKPNIVRVEILGELEKYIDGINDDSSEEFKGYIARLKEVVDNFDMLANK